MFVCKDGFKLGAWIANHRDGDIRSTDERKERLNSIGMIWDKPTSEDLWEIRFEYAKKYYEERGNLDVPSDYRVDGTWLAKWLNEQKQIYNGKRKGKSLTDEQIKKLESIGFQWRDRNDLIWFSRYEMLKNTRKKTVMLMFRRAIQLRTDLSLEYGYKPRSYVLKKASVQRNRHVFCRKSECIQIIKFIYVRALVIC